MILNRKLVRRIVKEITTIHGLEKFGSRFYQDCERRTREFMLHSNSIFYYFRFIRKVTREKNLLRDVVRRTRVELYNKILRCTNRAMRLTAVTSTI